jgi:hypothetical protein
MVSRTCIHSRRLLAALLACAAPCSCGATATKSSGSDGGPQYVSCAYTSEPATDAEAPCTQYLGLRGNLAACGVLDASAAGPLSAAACNANCLTSRCSLVVDASVAPGIGTPGYPRIACGCN